MINIEQLASAGENLDRMVRAHQRTEDIEVEGVKYLEETLQGTMQRLIGLLPNPRQTHKSLIQYLQQQYESAQNSRDLILVQLQNLKKNIEEFDLAIYKYKDRRADMLTNSDETGTLDEEIKKLEDEANQMTRNILDGLPLSTTIEYALIRQYVETTTHNTNSTKNKLDRIKMQQRNIVAERFKRNNVKSFVMENSDNIALSDFIEILINSLQTLKFVCEECHYYDTATAQQQCALVQRSIPIGQEGSNHCGTIWSDARNNPEWKISDGLNGYNEIDWLGKVI